MSTVAFDLDAVRARFPALRSGVAYLDGPGGTQVPEAVIDAIAGYLRDSNANLGGAFAASRRSDELVERAHAVAGSFLGCRPQEAIFGANMTTLNFALSRTLGRELLAGHEIVVTRLDHDANVSPWLELAHDLDLRVSFVELREDTTLDLADLERKLGRRTRVVAFPLASNAVGTLTDAAGIAELAHSVGALAWADAVHYAPHGPIDVAALVAGVQGAAGAGLRDRDVAARAPRRLRGRGRAPRRARLGGDPGARARARRALPRRPSGALHAPRHRDDGGTDADLRVHRRRSHAARGRGAPRRAADRRLGRRLLR